MRNLEFTGKYFGEVITIKQIQKRTAKKLFNSGETVYLQSNNIHPLGVWSRCFEVDNKSGGTFESVVNSFEYYNCNGEAGSYAVFYKRIKQQSYEKDYQVMDYRRLPPASINE